MPTLEELEAKLARLIKEYADIKIISQSDPGPILDKRAIQREINHTERQIAELKAASRTMDKK
jgi:hypothetical protein